MENPELMKILEHTAHEFLMWVGFGTLVGLTAKAIMPGRDPGGAVGTLMMGIVGSVVGCGVLAFIDSGYRVSPISPLGFVAGTAGAFLLLAIYRVLNNSYIVEAVDSTTQQGAVATYVTRRRRRAA